MVKSASETTLPSQHDILPHLGVLDRLLIEKTPDERVPRVQRQTEQLPYYLRGACAAVHQLESARLDAVTILDKLGIGPRAQFVLPVDKVDPLSFCYDSFLFCMRRAFDALVPYLSQCPTNLSLPSSMNDLVAGIRKNKWADLDSEITSEILAFWDSVGWKIKGYQDQASHKAIILSNCVAFKRGDGVRGLRMLLPDNPDEKRPSELRYAPGVPAMNFATDSLGATIVFANALVERMIDLMAPDDSDVRHTGVVAITMRGFPLIMSTKMTGEPVPFPVEVADVVKKSAPRA